MEALNSECVFDKSFSFTSITNPPVSKQATACRGLCQVSLSLTEEKDALYRCKNQLSAFPLEEWSQHTDRTDLSGRILPRLKTEFRIEFPTRAWAKFFEIVSCYDIIAEVEVTKPMKTFHLCEGPGAFIAALNHYLQSNSICSQEMWDWGASTLSPYYEGNPLGHVIPSDTFILNTWSHWNFGSDGTGNIHQNISSLVRAAKDSMLMTADGGLDCSNDPGHQEGLVFPLLRSEVEVALRSLAPGGSFVLKLFTFFEEPTISLIYLLVTSFQKVRFVKPGSSKAGNSEIYAVCTGFVSCLAEIRDPAIVEIGKKRPAGFNGGLTTGKELLSMACISEMPEKFLEEVQLAAKHFSQLQQSKIDMNVALFQKISRSELAFIADLQSKVGEEFVQRTKMTKLPSFAYRIIPPNDYYYFLQADFEAYAERCRTRGSGKTESIRHQMVRKILSSGSERTRESIRFLKEHVREYFKSSKDIRVICESGGGKLLSDISHEESSPFYRFILDSGPVFPRPTTSRFASPRTLELWDALLSVTSMPDFDSLLVEETGVGEPRGFCPQEEVTVLCAHLRNFLKGVNMNNRQTLMEDHRAIIQVESSDGVESMCVCNGENSSNIDHFLDLFPETINLLMNGELKLLDRITVDALARLMTQVKQGQCAFILNFHLLTRLNIGLVLGLASAFTKTFLIQSQFVCGLLLINALPESVRVDFRPVQKEMDSLPASETLTSVYPLFGTSRGSEAVALPELISNERISRSIISYNQRFMYHLVEVVLFGVRIHPAVDERDGMSSQQLGLDIISCKETIVHVIEPEDDS